MCESADLDYAHVDENHRRARVEHQCYACRDAIRKGDVYRVTRAIFQDGSDHTYEHYKHCLRCASMLDAVRKQRPYDAIAWGLDCGEDWKDTIGFLPEEVAALAFLTADEAQQKLSPVRDLEAKP